MDAMHRSLTGRALLEVTSVGGSSMEQSVAETLDDVVEIETAAAIIQRPTVLFFGDHRVKLISLGITPSSYQRVHPYEITEGQSLNDAKGVLLKLGWLETSAPGRAMPSNCSRCRGLLKARVVGLFRSQETILTSGGVSLLMTLAAAQHTSNMQDRLSTIQIVLKPGANLENVEAEIVSYRPCHVARPYLPKARWLTRPRYRFVKAC